MPYGIEDNLWKRLPPEDQNEIINEYYHKQVVPSIGGYAPGAVIHKPAPTPTPTPLPTREVQSAQPPKVVWAYVRSLNSFPGNHPNFDADRAAGIGGYLLKADDPYLAFGANACRAAGFRVGTWDDPHGESAEAYAARMLRAAHAIDADMIAPDIEFIGKGYAGSAGWNYNTAVANALHAGDPNMALAVTPLPMQDDFNYAAWVAIGASVWIQSYGATLDQVFDPIAAYNRALANGVPPDMLTVILPAGSLSTTVKEVQDAGYPYWAIYTIDDVGSTDRSVPFGDNETDAPSLPYDPGSGDYGVIGIDEGTDDEIDTAYEVGDYDDYALALVAADEAGTLDEFLGFGGDRQFEAVRDTPGGAIHNTLGLPGFPAIDFWAKPGTILLAPNYGIVRRFSGHTPSAGWPDKPGGPWGWSIYFRAGNGHDFYITHLGTRIVPLGAAVAEGQPIGVVGHIPSGPPHAHIGVWDGGGQRPPDVRTAAGNIIRPVPWTAEPMRKIGWYDRRPGSMGPAGPTPVTQRPIDLDTVNSHWHDLMQTMDGDRRAAALRLRQSADRIMGIVK